MKIFAFFLCFSFCCSAFAQDLMNKDEETRYNEYTDLNQALKDPQAVVALNLRRTKLNEVPKAIALFTNLRYLDLSANRLEKLPDFIFNLPQLQKLDVSENRLYDIPLSVSRSKHLKVLIANNNPIQSIPYTIGENKELTVLNFMNTSIKIYPKQLAQLKQLQLLELRGVAMDDAQLQKLKTYLPDTKINSTNGCHCKY